MLSFLLCILFACQQSDKNGFSSNGVGVSPNDLGPTGSGSSSSSGSSGGSTSEDTSSSEDVTTGDLAAAENEDAPQISGADAFFSQYEGQGDIIEVHIYYSDSQDDIEGGSLALSYSNSETTGTESISLESSNESVILEEGEVTVLFADVDTSLDYQFRLRIKDAADNQSNEYTAVAPAN